MKYHQNIALDGQDQPAEYRNRANSAFFNEGKWRNFILPLLPPDPEDRTFIEIGCNVGLFLRLAKEYGFRNVIGVEKDPANCVMAERYRDAHGLDYRILNRAVGENFDWDELPVADVVLLANMHYYIPLNHFLPFLDRLFYKTVDCIVVSRKMRDKKHGHPLPELDALRLYFQDWQTMRVLETSSRMLKNDPHPRHVHSILFRSRLQRQPISDYTKSFQSYSKHQELIDLIDSGGDIELEQTENWAYWIERKQIAKRGRSDCWTDEQVRQQVQKRLDFTRDIMEHGMKEPILARPDRICIDGGNRAAVLRLLGYNSIIVRLV